MKTRFFYFSSTGNTLTVARDMAAELGGADVVSIPEAMRKPVPADAGVVGIFAPVYMFGLPRIVDDFIRTVLIDKAAYVFGVATYGGMPGMALVQMRRLLAGRGLALAAGFGVRMPGNYTPLYGAEPEARQKRMFDEEKKAVKSMADAVRNRRISGVSARPAWISGLVEMLVYRPAMKRIGETDRKFVVTTKCNGCGLCAKVCPVRNIRLEGGRPTWLHSCQHCMGCLQWCPQEAIDYGKVTVGRGRYHHPGVSPRDMTIQAGGAA